MCHQDFTAGGEMFEKIPNPLPGGNTHMITGRNPKNRIQSVFYLGNCERDALRYSHAWCCDTVVLTRWVAVQRLGSDREDDPRHEARPTDDRMGFCRSLGASLTTVLSWRHVRVVDLRTGGGQPNHRRTPCPSRVATQTRQVARQLSHHSQLA